jgi:hypothetical protein
LELDPPADPEHILAKEKADSFADKFTCVCSLTGRLSAAARISPSEDLFGLHRKKRFTGLGRRRPSTAKRVD